MNEPALDLAIVMALISSLKDKPVSPGTIIFGEVGLSGEVRAVSQAEQRVNEDVYKRQSQESKVREMALSSHRLERADEAYKSYGVLKYARRLAWKDAMVFLSHVMTGVSDGLLTLKEPCSIYSIMLGIQRANLQDGADRPLGREELDVARASYIRTRLPELK